MNMVYDPTDTERFILLVGPGVTPENVWKRLAIIVQQLIVPYYRPN